MYQFSKLTHKATLTATIIMALVGTGIAQTSAPIGVKAPKPAAEASSHAPANGLTKQAIQVSGYWKIDVRDADGTLATHREFENSLTSNAILPSLLLGTASVGTAEVFIIGNPGPCQINSGSTCILYPVNGFVCPPAFCMRSLISAAHFNKDGAVDGVTLSGFFTAMNDGNISAVETGFVVCGQTPTQGSGGAPTAATSPKTCATAILQGADSSIESRLTRFVFNGTGSSAPIPITAGQIVQISVLLSFS